MEVEKGRNEEKLCHASTRGRTDITRHWKEKKEISRFHQQMASEKGEVAKRRDRGNKAIFIKGTLAS